MNIGAQGTGGARPQARTRGRYASRKDGIMKTRQLSMRLPCCIQNPPVGNVRRMFLPVLGMLTLGVSALAQHTTMTTIDAPGAGTAGGYGTEGIAISPAGEIAGFYAGYSNAMHGYVRGRDGRIVTFDAPGSPPNGAGTPFPTIGTSQGTYAVGMDASGGITGYVIDVYNVGHSYVRAADGTFTMFDVPDAGVGSGQGTFAGSMSLAGTVTGNYIDANGVWHGFLRTADGLIVPFDAPGGGTGSGQGTFGGWAQCINPSGTIVGYYIDEKNVNHGYVRAHHGAITVFDTPGAGTGSGQGTLTWAINAAGTIAGTFVDGSNVYHGLLRAADGKLTIFDVPGAGQAAGQGTEGMGIDSTGVVTGYYTDPSGAAHGFLRGVDGNFTFFDASGAGTGSGQGTFPMTNIQGQITGYYVDSNGAYHGFVTTDSACAAAMSPESRRSPEVLR